MRGTGPGLAFRIDARALRCGIALHARTQAVAKRPAILVTRRIEYQRRIRRYTVGAHIARALVVVVRQVRVVVYGHHAARAIALVLFAIARCLRSNRRSAGRIVETTHVAIACPGLAFVIDAWALRRVVASDAAPCAIAYRAAGLAAHRVRRKIRIGRHARRANISRAIVVIDRNVRIVGHGDDRPCAVTLVLLAITRRLPSDRCSAGRIVHSARMRRTGTGLALRIHTRTLRRGIALHACTRAITKRAAILGACGVDCQRWIGGDAIRTNITRTLDVVDGQIGVVGDRDDRPCAVALVLLAITGRLRSNRRSVRREVEAAHMRRARSRLAFRIHARALRRRIALHTCACAITKRATILGARRIRSFGRIGRHAIGAHIIRAFKVIHRHVGVVVHIDDSAGAIALVFLAITGRLRRHRRSVRRKVEPAHIPRAGPRLALRVCSGTRRCNHALHAGSRTIANRAAALVARRSGTGGRIGRRACRAHVARALVVVDRNVAVVNRDRHAPHAVALVCLAITVRLHCDRRSRCRIRESAHARRTRACLAFRILAGTIARHETPDALPRRIAKPVASTHRSGHHRRIRRHAAHAHIVRARIAIDRKIRIIGNTDNVAIAIALVFLAITRRLHRGLRSRGDIREPTHTRRTRPHSAFRVDARTRRCSHALHTRACAIAHRAPVLIARGPRIHGWIRRHPRHAHITRARVAVIRHIGRARDTDRVSGAVALVLMTIAHHGVRVECPHRRKRHTADVRGARARVAGRIWATRAIGWRVAPNTRTCSIAHHVHAHATRRAHDERWIRRHAVCANV